MTQTFHDAVAAAWARMPERQDYAAQASSAATRAAVAGSLFPNAPLSTSSYVDDTVVGSHQRYKTFQAQVTTPIWLPGEGTASQRTARADGATIAATVEVAHLKLAGLVLDLATQASLAANARDVAARRLVTSRALAADLDRRVQVGESAQSDALAADADAASATVALGVADGQLGAAIASLAAITGGDAVPRLDVPVPVAPIPGGGDPLAGHPRVAAAERAVDAAMENARLVRIENRDSPDVGVVGISEQQPGVRYDNRVGIVLNFPFATEARNAPRRAAAEQAITSARVQLELARRDVAAQVAAARATLAGVERGRAAAARAAGDLDKRRGQIERAWRLGEMPLIEVVRANALAFDAQYARDKARTELGSARLRLRIAEGDIP